MKKQILYCSIAVALVLGIFTGANRVSAQDVPMSGAYAHTSASSKEVKRAAKFAVEQRTLRTGNRMTLIKIVKAEVQVVAGLNYRMVLRVSDRRGRSRTVTTVVFKSLKNRLSLTSWKPGESHE